MLNHTSQLQQLHVNRTEALIVAMVSTLPFPPCCHAAVSVTGLLTTASCVPEQALAGWWQLLV